jgi:hypothetical protein
VSSRHEQARHSCSGLLTVTVSCSGARAQLIAKETFIVPIPGTRHASHVIENMRAADIPWLHPS